MVAIFIVLFVILLYFIMKSVEDSSMCKKFKEGYTFETYKLIFHATETYELISVYKIIFQNGKYVIVKNISDENSEIEELNIHNLLFSTDKIIIKDNDGKEYETFYKLEPYKW